VRALREKDNSERLARSVKLRLIFSIFVWLIYHLGIAVPLILLGWITVPVAALCKAYKPTNSFDGVGNPRVDYHFTWPFMFVWDNHEDGIANDTYVKFESMFMRIVYWSCVRNPVNNLRMVPYLSCKIEPSKVKFIGSFVDSDEWALGPEVFELQVRRYDTKIPQWFFAWQGLHSNLYWQFECMGKLWRLWIGSAKIYPTCIYSVPKYLVKGSGPVLQFKRVKV